MPPTYVYKCENTSCGKLTERTFSIKEYPKSILCLECQTTDNFSPAHLKICAPSNYEIKGDNSGSTRPKGKPL